MAEIAKRRPVGDSGPESVELLSAILAELVLLRADVVALRGCANLPIHPTDAAIGDLLRAISEYCQDAAFSTRALVAHAQTMPALSAAIVSAVGILNARAVGKVLKAVEGRAIDDLQVQRLGLDAAGVIWRVSRPY